MIKSFYTNALKFESYKSGVMASTIINIFAKIFAFFNSVAIAFYFGANLQSDLYFFCYFVVTLVTAFFLSLNSAVIIPEAMRLKEQLDDKKSEEFINSVIYLYTMIGVLLIAILLISPVKILSLFSKYTSNEISENITIVYLSMPLILTMLINNLLVEVLASRKYFSIPMIASLVNNLMAIIFILIFNKTLNIKSVLIGMLLGHFINLLLLVCLLIKALNWKFVFKTIKMRNSILKNILYSQVGQIATTISIYMPMYMLSGLNYGIITSLSYGKATSDIPNQLITSPMSSVAGVKFNELYSKKEYTKVSNIYNSVLTVLFFVLIPICFTVFSYSEELITVLFKRGAFDSQSVKVSSELLRHFILLLPFLAINTISARLYMANQKIKQNFWYQVLFNIFSTFMVWISIKFFGYSGYPKALVFMSTLNTILGYYLLKYYFPEIDYIKTLVSLIKITFLNLIIFYSTYYVFNKISSGIVTIIISIILYIILLLYVNSKYVLCSEINELTKMLVTKIKIKLLSLIKFNNR